MNEALGAALQAGDIMCRAEALVPMLRERSVEIDEARALPADVVDALRNSGAFRMLMPRAWGGPEMTPMAINDVLEVLASGNASAAWCAMIQMDGGLYSGMLDAQVRRELFPSLDLATSNVLRISGYAQVVEGGFIVDGRWAYASGCGHSDRFAGGVMLHEGDRDKPLLDAQGRPRHCMLLMAPRTLNRLDTWQTLGLRGTGSHDLEAVQLFVPEAHAFSLDAPGHEGAIYRWPAVLCGKMPGVPLGIARAALQEARAMMSQRQDLPPIWALALAEAHTAYHGARAHVRQSLQAIWDRLQAGETPSTEERVDVFLARSEAFHRARHAVEVLFDALGGGAIYCERSSLERHLRDLNTACQHIMAQRQGQLPAAQLLLGREDAAQFAFL